MKKLAEILISRLFMYHISQLLDEELNIENRSNLKKTFYKKLFSASAVEFLNCIKLLKKNTNFLSSGKCLNFKGKHSVTSSKFSAEKFDTRFNLLHADIDDDWKSLSKYELSNMIIRISTRLSVTHFISRITCVRIQGTTKNFFR